MVDYSSSHLGHLHSSPPHRQRRRARNENNNKVLRYVMLPTQSGLVLEQNCWNSSNSRIDDDALIVLSCES